MINNIHAPFYLGTISNKWKYFGSFLIKLSNKTNCDNPPNLNFIFILIDSTLIPFKVSKIELHKQVFLKVKLEEVNSEKDVEDILNKEVFVQKQIVGVPTKSKETDKLIDYKLYNKSEFLGSVIEVIERKQQPLFLVETESKTILIPIHQDLITNIDHSLKIIKMELPEGLV